MLGIMKKRTLDDEQALTPTRNKLSAGALNNLLDERKSITTRADLEKLSKSYNMDLELLERLRLTFNSPSISETRSKDMEKDDVKLVR